VFRGGQLGVLEAEATQEVGDPGVILGIDATGVVVAAGKGAIRLRSVTPAGRRHMSAVEWANGARFVRGERLG
jgi:methionyl-tRNA formyltransferase